jgi:Fe-S-cluster-containing hydrogenase component 2
VSLLNAAERLSSIDRSQIILDRDQCLHSQDQHSECAACFNLCPVQAITPDKPPALNEEKCQSCLACLPACPVGAYHADDDVANLLTCITHVEEQPVEILCRLHPNPETGADPESIGIQIRGCLAGLGAGALLALSTSGLKQITLRTDSCSSCEWKSLYPVIHRHMDNAAHFLSALGNDVSIACVDEIESPAKRTLWGVKNPPLSRRDLFRIMSRQGQVALARAMENGVMITERKPGRDRLRVLSAVSHMNVADLPSTDKNRLEGFGFASLAISSECTACGACGRSCPTGALRFERDENGMTFSLSFSAQYCIGCEICSHVCLPEAIAINHTPVFEEVFGREERAVAVSGMLVRCERCNTLIAARDGARLCQLCEYRQKNPFGSKLPKKLRKEAPL